MGELLLIQNPVFQEDVVQLAALVPLIQHETEVTFLDKAELAEQLPDGLIRKDLLQLKGFLQLLTGYQILLN